MKPFEQQTYYELLEIELTASAEEIRAAHARALETYSPDSIAVYTLVEPEQLEALRQRLTEAMEILCEPDLRIEYDHSIGVERTPEEAARLMQEAAKAAAPSAEPAAKPEGVAEVPPEPAPASSGEKSAPEPSDWASRPSYILSYAVRGSQFLGPVDGAVLLTSLPAGGTPPVAVETAPATPEAPAPSVSEKTPPEATPPAPAPETPAPETPAPVAPAPAKEAAPAPARSGSGPVPPPLPPRNALRPPVRTETVRPTAPASPPSLPQREKTPPHPPAERPLGEAPVLAQDSAIATAESALAQVAVKARDSRSRLKAVDLAPESEFNGELLRRVRESKSLTVQALAERTRISARHLENIEADRYDGLPATVYLRGMLMSIARELGLDPLRVSKSYMGLAASSQKRR